VPRLVNSDALANPADVLGRIVADRRRRVAALKLSMPVDRLRKLVVVQPLGRLERALRREGPRGALRLICEVKRASPSKGALAPAIDPVATARLYEQGGATAVSLVTEPDHFQGDPAWVNAVRPQVKLPILMKDFVIDSYQIVDAAARGADAVLLIAAILSPVELQRYINEARVLGLDALVEVHDAIELQHAITAGATIVGINNRDLRTFEVRLETSAALLPKVPSWVTAVAESGISAAEHLASLRATRCDAVLIGEALMTSDDLAGTLARLRAAARG
jgi:indole-3-glycerol phosphate synthase